MKGEAMQLTTDDYPLYGGTPPHISPQTSKDAAESIRPNVDTLRGKVLRFISASAPRGLTDEEGIELTGMPANTYRPRRRELQLLGLIRSDETRATRSGRQAKVWVVA